MSTTSWDTDGEFDGLTDVPLIVEDLLCRIGDLGAASGDPATIAELWAQVDLLQGR